MHDVRLIAGMKLRPTAVHFTMLINTDADNVVYLCSETRLLKLSDLKKEMPKAETTLTHTRLRTAFT